MEVGFGYEDDITCADDESWNKRGKAQDEPAAKPVFAQRPRPSFRVVRMSTDGGRQW
jgi:hypothetical protein